VEYHLYIPAVSLWAAAGAAVLWAWRVEARLARMLSVDRHEQICTTKHMQVTAKLDDIAKVLNAIAIKVAVLEVKDGNE
jgi:hypothetical protein